MILYHYTTHRYLAAIMEQGLTRGEVPISDKEWLNGVNLTTSPEPSGHGLQDGWEVITEAVAAKYAAKGINVRVGTAFPDKREVRIKVKIPSSDRNLQQWLPWARKHVPHDYIERLINSSHANPRAARSWFIYWGVVPPSAFLAVDHLKPPYLPPELERDGVAA